MGCVQQVVASRFFSALLSTSRRVWTFGAGFNGELGSNVSWATSPQPIADSLQQVSVEVLQCSVEHWWAYLDLWSGLQRRAGQQCVLGDFATTHCRWLAAGKA